MTGDRPKAYIVDTNVLSRRSDQRPGSPVERWIKLNASLIRISVITIAEVKRGLLLEQRRLDELRDRRVQRREQAKQDVRLAWYERLRFRFADRIEPIDAEVAERWAEMSLRFPSLRDGDKAILATALVRGYGVATRNTRDFKGAGAPCVDPFDPASWGEEPETPASDAGP